VVPPPVDDHADPREHRREQVRRTLAHYAGRPAKALHPRLRLEADLDLMPLELVLVATEIEEAVGMEVPVEGLASVETVADLMRFFRRALAHGRRSHPLRRVA